MKQHTVTTYSFSELSEKAKQKALTDLVCINVMGEWWEDVYEDADNVGVKITEFDIDRGSYCKIRFPADSAYEVATAIIQNHGEVCDTYKTAATFIKEWDELVKHYSNGVELDKVAEGNEDDFDEAADGLETEFMGILSYDYLKMLREEYEYLTSEEAILETIEANEFEFLESGKQYF